MAINTITYSNKSDINTTATPAVNKVSASDMNEIKSVVNSNANVVGDPANLPTTASDIVGAISEVNSKIETYSTTEKKVGIWINNKPIYRKTIDMGNIPNSTYKDVNHNISNMDEIVRIYGTMTNPSNHITTPLNMRGTGGIYGDNTVVIRADRTKVTIGCSSDYSSNIAYVTLEYTKTTD